jgi:hypothetical protein
MSLETVYMSRVVAGQLDPNYVPLNPRERLYLCAVMNSLVVDAWLKRVVTKHLSFFYVLSVPVPRLIAEDAGFLPLVDRAAQLVCTTSEFDVLAREVSLKSHRYGVVDLTERARLRAELDGLVAHLYGLTEAEFAHILRSFPLVPDPVKLAVQNAYRDVERGLIK